MIKITMLPAMEGDFLCISFGSNKMSHIVIDGGVKRNANDFVRLIQNISQRDESIEALIITHIDQDHIQGAIQGISKVSSEILKKVIKRIFFNTSRGFQKKNPAEVISHYVEDTVSVKPTVAGYSVRDSISFLQLLDDKNISDCLCDYIVSGDVIEIAQGAIIKIISPGREELLELVRKWEPYVVKHMVKAYSRERNADHLLKDLKQLRNCRLWNDTSINNRSSIAFLFEYENKKLAFLGDSDPGVCIKGLEEQSIILPCDVALVKLSHHGSRGNTSDALLRALPTNYYLLSTNGHGGSVPSKVLISHLIDMSEKYGDRRVRLLCNYSWWDFAYHNKYFTKNDIQDFFETNRLTVKKLSTEEFIIGSGITVSGGLYEKV